MRRRVDPDRYERPHKRVNRNRVAEQRPVETLSERGRRERAAARRFLLYGS